MDIAGCSVKIRTHPRSFQKSPVEYIAKLQSIVAQLIQFCLKYVHWIYGHLGFFRSHILSTGILVAKGTDEIVVRSPTPTSRDCL